MAGRRILSLWLPRLSAERALRRPDAAALALGGAAPVLVVVAEEAGAPRLVGVSAGAAALGLGPGMTLTDARAIHPALIARMFDPAAEAAFRAGLLRWAGRFSPWVAPETTGAAAAGEGALALDIAGCAHLFGGEAAMARRMIAELADLGLSARAGIADARGAAWALARFAPGAPGGGGLSGDAVAAEARATRVRAPARKGRGRAAPPAPGGAVAVAPPGGARAALAPLPVAALRLPQNTVAALSRIGLRRIGELAGMPRAALARRFGADVLLRLDQAFGAAAEPVSPAAAPPVLAVRFTLPEPIGLRADLEAALARLLARLAARLEAAGLGARRLRLSLRRVDGEAVWREIGLARPTRNPARLAPLFARALEEIDAGFGIDAVRLEAVQAEPLSLRQHRGPMDAAAAREAASGDALADLIGRLGARIGLERLLRFQPADSHIPEKTARLVGVAWTEAAGPWPAPHAPRPVLLWTPEPAAPLAPGRPPPAFRWRRAVHEAAAATGPERIAREWWLDDPAWRCGARDYWRVETAAGARLWLFEARGGAGATPGERGGWFVHGVFA